MTQKRNLSATDLDSPPPGYPPRESRSTPIPTRFVGLVVRGELRALGYGLRYAVRELSDHHHMALQVILQRGNRVQARRAGEDSVAAETGQGQGARPQQVVLPRVRGGAGGDWLGNRAIRRQHSQILSRLQSS